MADPPAPPDPPVRHPLPRKRDVSRQRLLAAANKRFREQGYDNATVASIAKDAGVTERTFFRYFPTKAHVLMANWETYADDLRVMLRASDRPDAAGVVTDALGAFLHGIADEMDAGLDSAVRLFADRAAFLAITEYLLGIEFDLALEIGRRTGRPFEDYAVRVAANASFGVLRAAVRARVIEPDGPTLAELLETGMAAVQGAFDGLDQRGGTAGA
jgi:AcrR family transcriptional regulator